MVLYLLLLQTYSGLKQVGLNPPVQKKLQLSSSTLKALAHRFRHVYTTSHNTFII